jgi:hypothetical protein
VIACVSPVIRGSDGNTFITHNVLIKQFSKVNFHTKASTWLVTVNNKLTIC